MDILSLAQPIRDGIYITVLVMCMLYVSIINKTRLPNKIYLVIFLALKVTIALCEWLLIHVPNPSHYLWLSLLFVLSFGCAPMLLRFSQGVTTLPIENNTRYFKWLEWVIVVAAVVLIAPLFLASKALMSFEFGPGFGRLIHITMSLCILLYVAQVGLYWRKAYIIYAVELQRTKATCSSLQQRSLTLLKLLLILVLVNLVFSLVRTFNVWFWQSQSEIALIANILEYTVLLCCLFAMFHSALPVSIDNSSETEVFTTMTDEPKPPKYTKTPLDSDFRNRIIGKLQDKVKVTQLAFDSTLSLNKFSEAVGEKPYYVTQVLNQDLHTNFYEYITDHRIHEVARRLSAPCEQTIFDLALAVGFNSKSTFNTAFKKRFGVTPSQFRANPAGCISSLST